MSILSRLAAEPPIRLLTAAILKRMTCGLRTRMRWDLSPRPAYLLGLGEAAIKAKEQGIPAISAIECGVAAGDGLVILEREAMRIEQELGLRIDVYGIDRGTGLPETSGDYRDHPDYWKPGDFPMDIPALKRRLKRAELVIGDAKMTLPIFVPAAPVAFVSLDMDLYTSTRDCLQWLARVPKLLYTSVYVDDILPYRGHSRGGALRAIHEFNDTYEDRCVIEPWRGVTNNRPFPERGYLQHMFVCHDLQQISAQAPQREVRPHVYGV